MNKNEQIQWYANLANTLQAHISHFAIFIKRELRDLNPYL